VALANGKGLIDSSGFSAPIISYMQAAVTGAGIGVELEASRLAEHSQLLGAG
jgi:hypothetical protein